MTAVRAHFVGLGDDGDAVAEVGVFQHAGEFARGPKFVASGVDALDMLKRVLEARRGNGTLMA